MYIDASDKTIFRYWSPGQPKRTTINTLCPDDLIVLRVNGEIFSRVFRVTGVPGPIPGQNEPSQLDWAITISLADGEGVAARS